MFQAGIFSLLMLLLAGCSATHPSWVSRVGVTEEQGRFDREVCRRAAGNMLTPVPGRSSNPFPSIGLGDPPIADRMAAFDACMESKGYRRP